MNPPASMSLDERIQRMRGWMERIERTRIFRPVKVVARRNPSGTVGEFSVIISDGLNTIKSVPFTFEVATMDFALLYQRLRDEIAASFLRLVDEKLAPETVFAGTSPVKLEKAETDGEEWYEF